jgi:hypothetical protein
MQKPTITKGAKEKGAKDRCMIVGNVVNNNK